MEATHRIGRLVELVEFINAAAEFEGRAQKAAIEAAEIGKLTVREGNPGDDAVNEWIAAMMAIYREITGKELATSLGAPGLVNEGIAGGPLIRFLQAAGKPLEIQLSEDALRSRVRTIEGLFRAKLRSIWPFRSRTVALPYPRWYAPTRFDIGQEQTISSGRSTDRACASAGTPGCR